MADNTTHAIEPVDELLGLLNNEDMPLTADEKARMLRLIEPKEPLPFESAIAATKALIQRKAS